MSSHRDNQNPRVNSGSINNKTNTTTKIWGLLANRSCCGLGCRECPFDPRGEKGTSRIRPVFQVERDYHGFAIAISAGDDYILHLSPGTTRNEAVIQKLVDVLNAAICGMLENESKSSKFEEIWQSFVRAVIDDLI